MAHASRQVLGAGEGHDEDVGVALRERLLVQHVLAPTISVCVKCQNEVEEISMNYETQS